MSPDLLWYIGGVLSGWASVVIFSKVIMKEYKKILADLMAMKQAYEIEIAKN